jgi:hypothetical protein
MEEMVITASRSLSTMTQKAFEAMDDLLSHYESQHRWRAATDLIEKVFQGIWPSLFSVNVQDVTLVSEHVNACVKIAWRLAKCYQARRRSAQEKNIRVRVYRALRSSREVDDKLRKAATKELLDFFHRNSQTEVAITMQQELLNDYTEHYGDQDPTVIDMLWKLAELTRPRPVFVEYYRKIIHALNHDSETCKPKVLEPVMTVAAELWSKGLFSEALPYYRMLFVTFLKTPETSSQFQDQAWVRELFIRYTDCLNRVESGFTVLHTVISQYYEQCKARYGAAVSITIHAMLTLAALRQESRGWELEAMTLYDQLLQIDSDEVDKQEISAKVQILLEELSAINSIDASSSQVTTIVRILHERLTEVRETCGWAHEESLFRLKEVVRFYHRLGNTEAIVSELRKATINVLLTEKSSTRLMAAASSIASIYIATKQVQKATELMGEIYRQIVMKEKANTETSQLDLSACGSESLVFLARLQYELHRSAATLTEILAGLEQEFRDFREVVSVMSDNKSTFLDVSRASGRLHSHLVTRSLHADEYVIRRFRHWFREREAKRLELSEHEVDTIMRSSLLPAILDHFASHESNDMVRTVGIIGKVQVGRLLHSDHFHESCDLTMACFHYIKAHDEKYRSATMIKLVLKMGMALYEPLHPRNMGVAAFRDPAFRDAVLETSRFILLDVLRVLDKTDFTLAKLNMTDLNNIVRILYQAKEWEVLAPFLHRLWASREVQRDWSDSVTSTLARQYIVAHQVVGDVRGLRTAERIVYNCRRVRGLLDPVTLDMSILLAQLYTDTAQRYQQQQQTGHKGRGAVTGETVNRYYKKAAAIHENILRVFSDPAYAVMNGGSLMDGSNGHIHGGLTPDIDGNLPSPLTRVHGHFPYDQHHREQQDVAPRVRQHLHLLKLAVQRLGA